MWQCPLGRSVFWEWNNCSAACGRTVLLGWGQGSTGPPASNPTGKGPYYSQVSSLANMHMLIALLALCCSPAQARRLTCAR